MVAPLAAWGGVAFLAATALVTQQLVKPRLPVYNLQVISFPSLTWLKGQLLTRLFTDVQLHNDNFMQIDVYGLSFDVFYMSWDGDLALIASVQDENLAVLEHNASLSWHRAPEPLWRIQPRADFAAHGDFYLTSFVSKIAPTLSRLVWSLWQGGGTLLMPTMGVIYIKAASSSPFTVSLVCDNIIDTWRMNIKGVECALKELKPGWADVTRSVASLRIMAATKLKGNATGGVLQHAKRPTFEETIQTVALEEVLQLP